jgi:CDP-diacylglycerol--glycerol-3-phosphate 3-phosphatidyltransferase
MNLPNLLTLSRVPAMFIIAALLIVETEDGPLFGAAIAALVVFILGALTDWLDGYLARKQGQVTKFGIYMDALTDKIFMVGMMVTLVAMPAYRLLLPLVLIILAREFFITGMRLIAANRGVVVAAEKAGKQKTVLQILSVGILLLDMVLRRDVSRLVDGLDGAAWLDWITWSGIVMFFGATLLTVNSGISYLRKYGYLLKG